jgi:hypothetical protein
MELDAQIKESEATMKLFAAATERHPEDEGLREQFRVAEDNHRNLCAARTRVAQASYMGRFIQGLFQ